MIDKPTLAREINSALLAGGLDLQDAAEIVHFQAVDLRIRREASEKVAQNLGLGIPEPQRLVPRPMERG